MDPMDRGVRIRLSLLTFLILGLIGVLIVYTGYEAAYSERQFFRRLALDANKELSRMVAREFVHVFTSHRHWAVNWPIFQFESI